MRTPTLRVAGSLVMVALALTGCDLADARRAALQNASVHAVDMTDALRPGLVGMPDYPATGWEPSEAPAQASDTATTLAGIGLLPSDLASGLTVHTVPDGTSLGTPTLDFCEGKYPSESLRVRRLQRAAYDSDGAYAGISTEVVLYKSVAAAQQALREATAARVACPVGTKVKTFDGHTLVFAFHPAPGPSDTPLVPANARLIIHTTMQVDGQPQTTFIVYQIQGRALAALYASDDSGKPFPQATLDAFYGLAGDIAQRLIAVEPTLKN